MNVLIPHSWLLDYIKTSAQPEDIAKALSLHAFSCEKIIDATDGDKLYEIEVTPNRGDALSVLGIARELKAVLPRQGFGASWQTRAINDFPVQDKYPLDIEIVDPTLVPRFSAIILDNVKIGPSPTPLQSRLEKVGTRALNNVIDTTNYFMFDKGQPMHVFDYDKILGHKMIVRESKEGEEVVTLDNVSRKLPAGVIVIEDGSGRLIDLCGIMGGKNSEVDENTKRVLLFVQVYDPVKIRKASMSLGHRTEAALRFEKGIDFEGVIPALYEAAALIIKEAGATASSKIIDIVNVDYTPKEVVIDYERINYMAGIPIQKSTCDEILIDLGFSVFGGKAVVPSWRHSDINLAEDLAEEVIRIYGYYKLPNLLPETSVPVTQASESYYWEDRIKDMLKFLGFFECYTHSMTSKDLAGKDALALANPLSEDFAFMRTSLIPQLKEVLEKNQGFADEIRLFEMASVYHNQSNELPNQRVMLCVATKGVSYLEVKGYLEAIYSEMRVQFQAGSLDSADSGAKDAVSGSASQSLQPPQLQQQPEIIPIGKNSYGFELNFDTLMTLAKKYGSYAPITRFNSIKEDMTFEIDGKTDFSKIMATIYNTDARVHKTTFKDLFKNALTLSIEFLDKDKQITSEDTKAVRENISGILASKYGMKLKALGI